MELQKEIVPILTELFPNIQFILTTHSPFILNSAKNAVVYDLEYSADSDAPFANKDTFFHKRRTLHIGSFRVK